MKDIQISDLDKDYLQTQINRFKGIMNSAVGEEGKPLSDEKVLAIFSIFTDTYNEMCYTRKEEMERKDEKNETQSKVYEAKELASVLAGTKYYDDVEEVY